MKAIKTSLVFFGLFGAFATQAQFSKGEIILEGNLYFAINFKDNDAPEGIKSPYQLGLGTSVGFLVNARNELGVGLGWSSSRSAFLPTPDLGTFPYPIFFGNIRKAWSLAPRVFWRHYSTIFDKLLFSSGVAFDTRFGNTEYQDFSSGAVFERGFTQLSLGYTPSLVYRFNPRFGVRGNFGLVGFLFGKEEGADEWGKSFSANFSPQNLNFGLFFLLNGSKSTE
jgi:hypothetical protein